jgi:hypothetical protein
MSFAWSEYLTVAEALIDGRGTLAPEEAYEGLTLQRTGRDHQRVLLHYRRRPDRTHQEIAELLFRLRRQRNQADYDDQMSATVTGAHTALRRARQVLAGLETLQT